MSKSDRYGDVVADWKEFRLLYLHILLRISPNLDHYWQVIPKDIVDYRLIMRDLYGCVSCLCIWIYQYEDWQGLDVIWIEVGSVIRIKDEVIAWAIQEDP